MKLGGTVAEDVFQDHPALLSPLIPEASEN